MGVYGHVPGVSGRELVLQRELRAGVVPGLRRPVVQLQQHRVPSRAKFSSLDRSRQKTAKKLSRIMENQKGTDGDERSCGHRSTSQARDEAAGAEVKAAERGESG